MAQRFTSFLVVLLLIFYGETFAQKNDCFPQKKGLFVAKNKGIISCSWNPLSAISPDSGKILLKLPINHNTFKNFDFEKQLKLDYPAKDTPAIRTTDPLYLLKPTYVDLLSCFTTIPLIFKLPDYNYRNEIGFFCKKELQFDKITPVAFRFRLGSLNYVNWMEQKPNVNKE